MTTKFLRNDNNISTNFIRPGVCVISFGIMYRKSADEVTRWLGAAPIIEWVDSHHIRQAMKTWWFAHRLWMTISASSGQRLTNRQRSKLARQSPPSSS